MHILQLFHLAAADCGTAHGVLPGLFDGLCPAANNEIQITSIADVVIIIGNLVRILIAISGSLAVILLLIASIYYITATGDPARVKRARDIIRYTVAGLGIIILSYSLITFISGEF